MHRVTRIALVVATMVGLSACGDSFTTTPIVSITATPLEGYAPLAVSFSSSTGGGEAPYGYAWDFGDGATSTDANPTHEYTTASAVPYVAVLTVTDGKNAVATATVLVAVGADSELGVADGGRGALRPNRRRHRDAERRGDDGPRGRLRDRPGLDA